MTQPDIPLRQIIPERRISCACIRDIIAQDASLGRWTREERNGIRPKRLALLVRRSIWFAHDLCYHILRERLDRSAKGIVEFPVTVEVYADKQWRPLTSCTRFERTASGRVVARLTLRVGDESGTGQPITRSPILLKPRRR